MVNIVCKPLYNSRQLGNFFLDVFSNLILVSYILGAFLIKISDKNIFVKLKG